MHSNATVIEAMPEFELYLFDFCPYGQRALITLLQGNIPHKLTLLDPDNLPEWFSTVSPLGYVPVLQVDGTHTVFESAVINEYLAQHAETPLVPESALRLAEMRAWIEYGSSCQGGLMQLLKAEDETCCRNEASSLMQKLAVLDAQLKTSGPYFDGETFTIIDSTYAPLFMRMEALHRISGLLPPDELPERVRRWSDALLQTASVQRSQIGDFPRVFRSFVTRKAGGGFIDRSC